MGELQRMTQFKEKAGRDPADMHVGLFDYPVLMAADILLYGTDLVPVGDDQKQHIEFARRIARKFNGIYGEVFRIPEIYTPRTGARLMGLQTPTAKMSKSDRNPDNYVALLDPPEVVRRKIQTAVTDSGSEIRLDAAKPGISNLLELYGAVTGENAQSIQNRYAGKGYAEFKRNLAERVIDCLSPIQARYRSIAADPAMLAGVLNRGARNAWDRSETNLSRVHQAVGFIPYPRDPRRRLRDRRSSSERMSDIAWPAEPRALHERRNIMETQETQDVNVADAEAECITDCCVCCCCDTDEECSMEE
jgi:tryptophanyl-tRNA synthetase